MLAPVTESGGGSQAAPPQEQPWPGVQPKHREANRLIGSKAKHVLLYGGSRSGKTLVLMRALLMRAIYCESRHAVLRYRFNHLKGSIIYDTLPKMMDICFPGLWPKCKLDKTDWFFRVPSRDGGWSEIWFGGLDDKERTEKILGAEYSTIYFNECSQIPWTSRNMAITRLAQNSGLRLKAFYDANPPSEVHWLARLFMQKVDPDTRIQIRDKDDYASMRINPIDNLPNLPAEYIRTLESLPERMRRRFLLGEFGSAAENALWSYELLDKCRQLDGAPPEFQRIVVAVDPSGCRGEEDTRSDEVGIVVVALASDGRAYLLEDLSGRFAPHQWGRIACEAYHRHGADVIVGETNFGGAMVAEVIRGAQPQSEARIPFREVTASRGKVVRAEPIANLYEQGKVIHLGFFKELEDQLCDFTTAGFNGTRSPDRADALVWGVTALFPALTKRDLNPAFGGFANGRSPQVLGAYSRVKRKV